MEKTYDRIRDFDINKLIENAAQSDMMAGIPLPEKINMNEDGIKCIVKYDCSRILFAVAYFQAETNLMHSDDIEMIIADLWKNSLIDEAYNLLREELEQEAAASGLYLSALYGPGYYEMPISDVKLICELVDAEKIGIKCEASGCMNPSFSRCGFFVVSNDETSEELNACRSCRGNPAGCSMCGFFRGNNKQMMPCMRQ